MPSDSWVCSQKQEDQFCLFHRHIRQIVPIARWNFGLARESGFLGVVDLLKIAKHGRGDNIYLVRFHYRPPDAGRTDETDPA